MWFTYSICLLVSLNFSIALASQNPSPIEEALTRFKETSEKLTEYTVTHIQQEKFKDKLGPLIKMKVKFSRSRVYLHILEGPKEGAEILFNPKWNEGKARVHLDNFLGLTLNLDPHGSRMLSGQHHPIEYLSFPHIVGSLVSNIQACKDFPESSGRILPSETSDLVQIELKAPWKEREEKAQKNEDIWAFAQRVKSDPFLILYINDLEHGDDLSEGQILRVPLCYSPRTLLTIDSKTFLPRKIETMDKQGKPFESYEWQDLNTQPDLTDLDFDPKNNAYHF